LQSCACRSHARNVLQTPLNPVIGYRHRMPGLIARRKEPGDVPLVVEMGEASPDIFTPRAVGIQSLAVGSTEEQSTPSDDTPRYGCRGMANMR
jgi:hypothetical protein